MIFSIATLMVVTAALWLVITRTPCDWRTKIFLSMVTAVAFIVLSIWHWCAINNQDSAVIAAMAETRSKTAGAMVGSHDAW